MLLDLSRLRGGVEALDREYPPAAVALEDDAFRVIAPVALKIEARKDAKKVRLTGRLRTAIECECSRCLESFATPIDTAIDLLLLPAAENAGEGEREVGEDDLGVSFYQNETVDLAQVVREQLYLALPMKPLCRDDCAGLCPVCGVNRNRETCDCQTEWVDPRLDALRALKNRN